VYFNPALPADQLLPDGTDPNQSPGEPFVRRMWAGGTVRFRNNNTQESESALRLDSQLYGCVEGIRDVSVKGEAGKEKVFVGIERRMGLVNPHSAQTNGGDFEAEDAFRVRIWRDREADFGDSAVIERRNIVFMRERSAEEMAEVLAMLGQAPIRDAATARKRSRYPLDLISD
jgi:hydroxyacyl-ACP dehydratase HTD2-like protein with hotdog domain